MTIKLTLSSIAHGLNGKVEGDHVRAPRENKPDTDDALIVWLRDDGLSVSVYSHGGEDWKPTKEYVCGRLGIKPDLIHKGAPDKPSPAEQTTAQELGAVIDFPNFDGKKFIAGDLGQVKEEAQRWIYTDLSGRQVKIVVKRTDKRFRQVYRVRNGDEVGWQWKKPEQYRDVPYLLEDLRAPERQAEPVFITEGEKDADAGASIGLLCVTFGSATACPKYGADLLTDRDVVIVGDLDEAGYKGANKRANWAAKHAASVRIWITKPITGKVDDNGGFDLADWVQAGGTPDAALMLIDKLEDHDPAPQFVLMTEDAAAVQFSQVHENEALYDHQREAWYLWDGSHWQRDAVGKARNMVRHVVLDMTADAKPSVKMKTHKNAFYSASLAIASNLEELSVEGDEWDPDGMALGTPGGIVDLETGQLRKADPRDLLTRTTTVTPAETDDCDLWKDFVFECTGGDPEMVVALRRWCGYCLTGSTEEQCMVFMYGPGGNGKGVFANILMRAMGPYAIAANMSTFTAQKFDAHPEELAKLRHARMVTASETEAGKAWAEAKVKTLTGGDMVSARFMRQNTFEYKPRFKLNFYGNHQPLIASMDEGIKRRFNMIPFLNRPARRDLKLEDRLAHELPGILRWMINGAAEWREHGLHWPQSVQDSTAEYLEEQDIFGQWMAECVELVPKDKCERTTDLFASWREFAKNRAEDPGGTRQFASNLRRFELYSKQIYKLGTKGVEGVALKGNAEWSSNVPDQGDFHDDL